MKRIEVLVFWIFAVGASGFAQTIEIRVLNLDKKFFHPGNTTNLVLEIKNLNDDPAEVSLQVLVPEGWSQLVEFSSISLQPKEVQLKILPIFIPESAQVKQYPLELSCSDQSSGKLISMITIPIQVEPRYGLDITKIRFPKYLTAGDSITSDFFIHNLSNLETKIDISILNARDISKTIIRLKSDSIAKISVPIKTDKNLKFYTSQSVTIIAEIPAHPETKVSKSYIFDIIPGNAELNDNYHRLPVRFSTMFVANNRWEKQIYSVMFDIQGGGKISANKDRMIEFQIRGPRSKGNPLFGINDKYYLKYSADKTKLIIGDSNYRLSDLTESSRSGIGFGYEYHGKKSIAVGFINFPRYYPKIKFVTGAYWLQHLNKNSTLKTGVLHKVYDNLDYADLLTVSYKANPIKWLNLETELAGGIHNRQFNKAFKLITSVQYKTSRSYLTVIHADRDFPGYYNNTRLIVTGVSSKLTSWATVSANYNTNYSTLAIDTLFSNTPFSRNIHLMTNFKINNTSRLSLGYFSRIREARTEPVLFNYTENSARISVHNTIKKIGIDGFFEYGQVNNYLLDSESQTSNSIQANVMIRYKIKPQVVLDGFLNFQKGNKYLSDEFQRFIYGASFIARLNKSFKILVSYQNDYEPEQYFRDRSLMNISTSYIFKKKHEFSLSVKYHLVKNHLNKKEFTALFRYSYSMGVRAGKLRNIGSFSGQIRNNGVESVEGIIVKLGNKYSITNENGIFEFPQVQEGNYLLMVDESNTGLNTILEEHGPYPVQIMPGQNPKIDLSLTKSARIEGRIIIQKDSNELTSGYIQTREEIKSLIIEAKKGDEIFRLFSNKDGVFSFYDLRPGEWEIKIYKKGLPYGYTIEKEEFSIQLSPGEVYHIQVPVIRRSIKIKFQKNGY